MNEVLVARFRIINITKSNLRKVRHVRYKCPAVKNLLLKLERVFLGNAKASVIND